MINEIQGLLIALNIMCGYFIGSIIILKKIGYL